MLFHEAPEGIDYEVLSPAVTTGAVLLVGAWLAAGVPLPVCVFHGLFGLPCPACGSSRAFLALLHGELAQAFFYNPLFVASLAGAALFDVYAVFAALHVVPRFRIASVAAGEAAVLRVAALLLIAGNWAYLIWAGV